MKRKSVAILMSVVMAFSTAGVMPSGLVYAQEEESMVLEEVPEEAAEEQEEETVAESDTEEEPDAVLPSEEEVTEQDALIIEQESDVQEETELSIDPQDDTGEENAVSTLADEADAETYDLPEGEPTESGTCGENATYRLYEDGSLYIEGEGAVTKWFWNNDNIKKVYIGEGITSLESEIFERCGNLESIILPSSLTSLGDSVFYGCSSLTSIELPSGLTSLGNSVFRDCSSMTSIKLPSTLTSLGDSVFYECSSLKEMVLPDNLTKIGKSTFRDCSDLRTVSLPAKIEKISDEMFSGCRRLSSMILPKNVTEIGNSAFSGCSSLKELALPSGLKKIGDYAFSGVGITEFDLPESLESIGDGAFRECDFTSIQLPASVKEIGSYAFGWCMKLETIVISSNITEIKDRTFEQCWKLENVTLSQNIKRIGKNAFYGCNLKKLDLPDSVTEIDDYAFSGNGYLTDVRFPKNLKTIKYGAFQSCRSLTNIQLPENLESIDTYAFQECNSLRGVYIPANAVSIESKAIGYGSDDSKNEKLVIIGKAGSSAESYANANGFRFHNVADSLTHYQMVASTCIGEGNVEYWHCNSCNTNFSNAEGTKVQETVIIEKIKHDLERIDYKEPTCTEDGNYRYWHCKFCGKNFEYSDGTDEMDNVVIPATGHNMRYYDPEEADCVDEGRKAYYKCWECDKLFLDEKGTQEVSEADLVIPKNNQHDLEWITGYKATCDNEGRKDYYECRICNKMFLDKNGTREISENDLVIPRIKEHIWGEWYVASGVAWLSKGGYDGVSDPINKKEKIEHKRNCKICGLSEKKSGTYTLKVNVDSLALKYGQSTTAVKVSGMKSGDYLKSVTVGDKRLVTVSNVSKKGTFKLTAKKKKGNTFITIELASGLKAGVGITVQKGTVKTSYIKGLKKSATLAKGKTLKLTPTVDPISSQEKITYSSSNKSVATVNAKGVVTGKKGGTAKITVKSGSIKFVVTVKVTDAKTQKINGVPSTKSIKAGKSFTIKATVTPKNSTEKITYTSSNKKVVTVTAKGVVKGLKKGTATITVKSGSKKKTCKVTVK